MPLQTGGVEAQRGHADTRLVVRALCAFTLIATPWLAMAALIEISQCFVLCKTSPAGVPEESHGVGVAFIVGTVLPVVGIALSLYTRQRVACGLFGLVLVLMLMIGRMAWVDDAGGMPPSPTSPPGTAQGDIAPLL